MPCSGEIAISIRHAGALRGWPQLVTHCTLATAALQRGVAAAGQRELLAGVDMGVAEELTVKGLSLRLPAPGFVP